MKKTDGLINVLFAGVITFIFSLFVSKNVVPLIIVFLISHPWKIGCNIYSLFGGINEDGNVNSLIALFQKGEEVFSVFNLCLFQIGKNEAAYVLGLCIFQKADSIAVIFGISLIQIAKRDVENIGPVLYLFQYISK